MSKPQIDFLDTKKITVKLDSETLEKLDKIVYVLKSMGFKNITRSDIVREGINYIVKDYYLKLDIDNLYAIYKQVYKKITSTK